MSWRSKRLVFASLALALQAAAAPGQVTWDGGGGADLNWSNNSNWNPDGSPSGVDTTFSNTASAGSAGTVNNVVDGSVTVDSLTYANNGSNFHTTQINSGLTLTVNGVAPTSTYTNGTSTFNVTAALRVGDPTLNTTLTSQAPATTVNGIGAAGSLSVNSAAADCGSATSASQAPPKRSASPGRERGTFPGSGRSPRTSRTSAWDPRPVTR
jgi:hypothetical protein